MTDPTQTVAVTPQHQPILEFSANEVYGLAADGLTAWQLGTDGYGVIPSGMGDSLIKGFRVWHTYEGAIYNYPSHRMTVDGLVYRVDPAATQYWPAAFQCGDYRNVDVTIRGGSIHAIFTSKPRNISTAASRPAPTRRAGPRSTALLAQ